MIFLISIVGGLYILVIASFFYGWIGLKPYSYSTFNNNKKVSVLIPFRNEEKNITGLLNALIDQSYPHDLTEIIAIDDHSTDNSANEIQNFAHHVRLIRMVNGKSGKKAALLEGLNLSNGDIIITTDADCIPGKFWIETIVNYYLANQPFLLLAPVAGLARNSVFNKLQRLEMFSLLGSTAGAVGINHPVMCNGANLSYPKEVLHEIRSVYDNNEIASGDDIFILQKFKKLYPGKIHYLKSMDAMVYTRLESSLTGFFNQRKRWAVKAKYYTDAEIILTASIVLLMNLLLLALFIKACITGIFTHFIFAFLLKTAIDLPFLYSITSFFRSKKLLKWFPVVQGFYFLYISFTFFSSILCGFSWKSRKLKS